MTSDKQEVLRVSLINSVGERMVADRVSGLLWGKPQHWDLLPAAVLEKGMAVLRELRRQAVHNKSMWQRHAETCTRSGS